MRSEIPIPEAGLDQFCRRWKIAELRVFGSALREEFLADAKTQSEEGERALCRDFSYTSITM